MDILNLQTIRSNEKKKKQLHTDVFFYNGLLFFFAPFVLFPYLIFFGSREIVLDVKRFPDLLRCFPLDHVGHRLASDVQQAFDVQIVGSQNELEQRALVYLEEIGVPTGYVVRALLASLVIFGWGWVVLVVRRPLDDFFQNAGVHVRQRDDFLIFILQAQVLDHGFDGYRSFGHFEIHLEHFTVRTLQLDRRHCGIVQQKTNDHQK